MTTEHAGCSGGYAVRCIRWFDGVSYGKDDAKRRIANMSGEWISVLKDLPPTDEPVLACWVPRKDGMACAMIRDLDGEYCWTPADQWTKCDAPTHWMPLPAPPTDAK